MALVIADGPKVRSFQRHEPTADFAYVRLQPARAAAAATTRTRELETGPGESRAWRAHGDVFVYLNNDWEGFAPANAATLRKLVADS